MSKCDNKKKTLLSWSTGKDCSFTLYNLLQDTDIELVGVFSTSTSKFERVSMHGVRNSVLKAQVAAIGLSLDIIELPFPCTNEDYTQVMDNYFKLVKKNRGIEAIAFGDIFLKDVKEYRINQMKGTDIEPIFPIWQTPTKQLSQQLIQSGFKSILTCIDSKKLDASFAGRFYDAHLLKELPDTCDPCGENGEFHTFVFDGPIFKQPIEVEVGEKVERDGFVFADLTLV